jgi:hypothetical protein
MAASSSTGGPRSLAAVVGVFALVGLGLGLTAVVVLSRIGGDTGGQLLSGLFVLVVLSVTLLLGPVVAAVVGLGVADEGRYGVAFVGTAVGTLVMVVLVAVLVTVGGPGGGDGGSGGSVRPGDWLVPAVAVGVVTGAVGAGTAALRDRVG